MDTPPTFEEWVHYCFTLGHGDFAGTSTDPDAVVEAREARFLQLEAETVSTYLIRLFKAPASVARQYSDQQLADATWFVLGTGSQYVNAMIRGGVTRSLQIECVRSISSIYADLFDPLCARRDTGTPRVFDDFDSLESAVFMIWDMDGIDKTLLFPNGAPHLVTPALGVLEAVLTRCRSTACIASALHAIGHVQMFHDTEHPIARRSRELLDALVATRPLPDLLLQYASNARTGNIQ